MFKMGYPIKFLSSQLTLFKQTFAFLNFMLRFTVSMTMQQSSKSYDAQLHEAHWRSLLWSKVAILNVKPVIFFSLHNFWWLIVITTDAQNRNLYECQFDRTIKNSKPENIKFCPIWSKWQPLQSPRASFVCLWRG